MKLSDLDFSALLPRFMRAQTDDVAMGDALSWMLKARQAGVESLNVLEWLRTTTNVEQMDDLAQAFGLVWWKPDWDLETKREMLLKSELIRQNPGTRWALEFVLRRWFGDDTLQVQEWFDYGGIPYTFRILTSSPDVQRQLQFSRIMESIKRTSQSMDGIFLGFSMRGVVRLGAKGSESRTDHGQAMAWPYIPKGTRYTHPDALEGLLWESGQTGTDAARAAVTEATGAGGVLSKDFPLIYAGDDTTTALPIKSTTRAAYQQAMASQWTAVGAEIAEPATSWVWPIPAPGGGLAEGCISYWAMDADEMSGVVSMSDSVTGTEWAKGSGSRWGGQSVADGKIGQALKPGANGTVSSTAQSGMSFGPSSESMDEKGTLACWFRILGGGPGGSNCFLVSTATGNAGVQLYGYVFKSSSLSVGVVINRSPSAAATSKKVSMAASAIGEWHHLAVTWETARTYTCYMDGEKLFDWTAGVDRVVESGRKMTVGPSGFGDVDEAGAWNRVLSADEVSQLYQAGLAGKSYPFEGY